VSRHDFFKSWAMNPWANTILDYQFNLNVCIECSIELVVVLMNEMTWDIDHLSSLILNINMHCYSWKSCEQRLFEHADFNVCIRHIYLNCLFSCLICCFTSSPGPIFFSTKKNKDRRIFCFFINKRVCTWNVNSFFPLSCFVGSKGCRSISVYQITYWFS